MMDLVEEMSSMSSLMYFRYMTTDDLLEQLFRDLSEVMREGINTDEMVEFIKRSGIQPGDYANAHIRWTQHPLFLAVHDRRVEHFHVLRNLGFYYSEQTLLDEAASVGNMEFVKILMELYPTQPTESAFITAANGGHEDVMDYLDTPRVTLDYSMCLISAARCHGETNRHAFCKQFLSRGADVNTRDQDDYGNTALHFAALYLDHTLVELLLDAGADVNVRNVKNETPFLVAANRDTGENEHGPELLTAKLLVSRGADLEATSTDGKTALHFAVCSPNLLHYLLVDLNLPVDGHVEDLFIQAIDFACITKDPINVLMSVGYYPQTVDVLLKLTEENYEISPNPKSLQILCCFKIRQVLGRRLPSVVDDLPLPARMTDFVRLSHLPQPAPVVWSDLEDEDDDDDDDEIIIV